MKLFSYPKAVLKLHISGVISSATLEKASSDLNKSRFLTPVALAIVMNSPGGSASHSSLIYHQLQNFGKRHKIPILSFAEDVAASGGYYIMCAGETIYASSTLSLIGSIGAMSTFISVKDLASKYGVEGRSWASSPKDLSIRLNPLKDLSKDSSKWMQNMLNDVNSEFQKVVEDSRKDKLTVEKKNRNELVFNGDVFNVEKAMKLGLVDAVGQVDQVIKEKFPKVKIVEISKVGKIEKIIKSFYH